MYQQSILASNFHRHLLFFTLTFFSSYTFASGDNSGLEKLMDAPPLLFEENKGQIADREGNLRPDVVYSTNSAGANIYIRKTGISYVFSDAGKILKQIHERIEEATHNPNELSYKSPEQLESELLSQASIKSHQVDVDFDGANSDGPIEQERVMEGYKNYYYAHCPDGITHVKQYQQIRQKNIYDGVDVVYYGGHSGLKYDIIVQPHADPNQIRMRWEGADEIEIRNGELIIKNSLGELIESIPKVYQNIDGKIVDVKAEYKLSATDIISFSFGEGWDEAFPLVIDPWVTYYGGMQKDWGTAVATDALGNVYMGGRTESPTAIASPGAYQAALGGTWDAFLVKFDANGNRLWATYYGGAGEDYGNALATDMLGNVYMGGQTASPTAIASPGAYQTTLRGVRDAFLVKFDANGNRLWATYFGGAGSDEANALATDALGNVYLGGRAASPTLIASPGAYQVALGGLGDAFLVKFDALGNRLWATYYGGTGQDGGNAVAIDAMGNVYMGGQTASPAAIASPGAHQTAYGGGFNDAFLVKFDAGGNRLWATYYGGTVDDYGTAVATDALGNVYLAGRTTSPAAIASPGAFQTALAGVTWGVTLDALLVKFDANGNRLWATYLGGTFNDYAFGLVVDPVSNHVFVSGDTYSLNFPVSSCAFQPQRIGGENSFITRFYPNGDLFCSSYFGSNHEEEPKVALSGCYIYLAGYTFGGLPATPGAHQTTYGGGEDAYLAQLYKSTCGLQEHVVTVNPSQTNNTGCSPCNGLATAQVNSSCVSDALYSYEWSTGLQLIDTNISSHSISGLCAGTYWVKVKSNCDQVDSISYTITGTGGSSTYTTSVAVCQGQSAMIHGISQSTAGVYSQTFTAVGGCDSVSSVTLDINPLTQNTITVSSCNNYTHNGQAYSASGIYTQTLVNAAGCDSILHINLTVNNPMITIDTFNICSGQSVLIHGTSQSTTGIYSQTFTAINGCDSTSSIVLNLYPSVTAAFYISPNPGEINETLNFTDQSTGANNWQWSFGDIAKSYSTVQHPVFIYSVSGNYQVQLVAMNNFECTDTALQLLYIEQDFALYVPNSFTPNGDNINEIFLPKLNGVDENSFELLIFDRWGNEIFKSTDINTGWDGRANGGANIAQIDTYVWVIRLNSFEGVAHSYTGHVNLIR